VAFGGFDDRGAGTRPMAEINMIPLIDVMLVVLVIFIITAPLLTHAVRIDLPKASSAPNLTRADHVQLAIDADGRIRWNGEPVYRAELRARLAATVALVPQPEIICAPSSARAWPPRSRWCRSRRSSARRPRDAVPGDRRGAGRG
jgi:biopolymer transport protein ExbD